MITVFQLPIRRHHVLFGFIAKPKLLYILFSNFADVRYKYYVCGIIVIK